MYSQIKRKRADMEGTDHFSRVGAIGALLQQLADSITTVAIATLIFVLIALLFVCVFLSSQADLPSA